MATQTLQWGRRLSAVALLALVLIGMLPQPAGAANPAVGRWISPTCEPSPRGGFIKRTFTLTADQWTATVPSYADPGCTQPTITLTFAGTYALGPSAAAVPGAVEATFDFLSGQVTPQIEPLAGLLSSAGPGACGQQPWVVGKTQDITATGCAPLRLTLPFTEYDLVKVEGDRLFFGARPADGGFLNTPERRPSALDTPLVREEQPAGLPRTAGDSDNRAWLVIASGLLAVFGFSLTRRAWRRGSGGR